VVDSWLRKGGVSGKGARLGRSAFVKRRSSGSKKALVRAIDGSSAQK